jgi:hypothetical protein
MSGLFVVWRWLIELASLTLGIPLGLFKSLPCTFQCASLHLLVPRIQVRTAPRRLSPSPINVSAKELSDTPSVFALAVSCRCMNRGSRTRTLPYADAGVKSSTLNAGAGTSCHMSTMALTVAINASRPSATAFSSVAPSAITVCRIYKAKNPANRVFCFMNHVAVCFAFWVAIAASHRSIS